MDGLPAGERYSFQSPPSRLDGIPSSKVHVIGHDIAQGLVVATPVVVLDEPADLGFRLPGSVQNNQMDAFLARVMMAFNLPIGLRRIGRSPDPSLVGASSSPEPGHTGRLAGCLQHLTEVSSCIVACSPQDRIFRLKSSSTKIR